MATAAPLEFLPPRLDARVVADLTGKLRHRLEDLIVPSAALTHGGPA
jgi:hypothetical protein